MSENGLVYDNVASDKSAGYDGINFANANQAGPINMEYYSSDMKHHLPFSFGLTALRTLNNHLALESGVVYTQLVSTYLDTYTDLKQRLHYLGVPLNLVISTGNSNQRWCFFVSAGGMLEKGVRASYVRKESWGNNTLHQTAVKTHIDGVQWSLSTALGLRYRFEKGIGLYVAPHLSYYFDNRQPVSVRSGHALSAGFNIGVNYEF
jgi:hypothetical protein